MIPAWGAAVGRHVIVTGADQRVLARLPIDGAIGDTAAVLDVISAAMPLAAPGQQSAATDITLPNGDSALAIQRADQGRCPARSSSSRKGSIRCGGRTRRCR